MKLLLTLLLLPVLSFGQKIESDTKDEFNGTREIRTTFEKLNGYNLMAVAALIIQKDTTFILAFAGSASRTTSINNNSRLLLKLDNNEILALKNRSSYSIIPNGESLTLSAFLSEEEIERLQTFKVVKVRFETSSENIDVEVDKKSLNKIPTMIGLLKEKKKMP